MGNPTQQNPAAAAAAVVITEELGYTVQGVQQEVLGSDDRLILVAGGERAGKSWISGLFGTTRTPFGTLFWIVAATYELARPEFEYWTQNLLRLGAIRSQRDISVPKVGKAIAVTKSGQTIETRTADDVRRLAAVAPDGIVMAEAAQQPFEAYLRCIGRLAEKRGWLLMSGTFEGSLGWYVEKFKEWQIRPNVENGASYSMPSWENFHIYPGGREDPEILRLEALYKPVPGLFDERCGAQPVPPVFLVFRAYREAVHRSPKAAYDPKLPVYLAVDPSAGTNPYAVLACQFKSDPSRADHPDPIDFCYVIDEVYEGGKICEEIIEIVRKRPWWGNVRGGAIDVEAPDDRRRWLKFGKVNLLSKKIKQIEGIRRLQSFLYYERDPETQAITAPPHLYLNPSKVKGLPHEFGIYRRKPPKEDDHAVKEVPGSEQSDHACKALWYLLLIRYGPVKAGRAPGVVRSWQPRSLPLLPKDSLERVLPPTRLTESSKGSSNFRASMARETIGSP